MTKRGGSAAKTSSGVDLGEETLAQRNKRSETYEITCCGPLIELAVIIISVKDSSPSTLGGGKEEKVLNNSH